MRTVCRINSNLTKQLKNGIIIRGLYARVPGQVGTPKLKIDLAIVHIETGQLWAESKLYACEGNPEELLADKLTELQAQVIDACVDQVPTSPKGLMLIDALIKGFAIKRYRARAKTVAVAA